VKFLKINLRFFEIGARVHLSTQPTAAKLTATEQTNARHTDTHTHIQGWRNEIQTREAVLSQTPSTGRTSFSELHFLYSWMWTSWQILI